MYTKYYNEKQCHFPFQMVNSANSVRFRVGLTSDLKINVSCFKDAPSTFLVQFLEGVRSERYVSSRLVMVLQVI